jgi:hypothetical protein
MGVGAKRGSEIQPMKYPVIIPAYIVKWLLYNEVSHETMSIRLEKHVVDTYNVTNFVDDNNRREKNIVTSIYYYLSIYKKIQDRKSYIQICSKPIPKMEMEYIVSNFDDTKLLRKWLEDNFSRKFRKILSNSDIIGGWKDGEFVEM